ncbi:metallophosphoesterase family protein [Microvirga sp. 2TAF3]|uniref:metallophosphoesterase family protein n=1 Tax=Microvirga sp. 2TAF3 TaxID=3233014 RepID=UPI003F9E1BAC
MPAMLTYAIGDIHGRHDLLRQLLEKIHEHAGARAHKLIFLGDYIDRGPESAAVIETIRSLQREAPERIISLMGNHEAMLLTAAVNPAAISWWLMNGGNATLRSFHATGPHDLPVDVLEWMSTLPTFYEDDRHYYVHAGLKPGMRFDQQTDEDRIWIREPFLDVDHDFGKHVVHGHTPLLSAIPDIRPFRTNLDTAAVFGGVLTAGIFDESQGPPIGFLKAGPPVSGEDGGA